MAHAIIAAAGSGERLRAGGPKALVEVAGEPMLAWSLRAFAAAGSIDAVVIAAPPPPQAAPTEAMAPWKWMLFVVAGGLLLHLVVRAFRRAITLRHLTHPFWNETLDQRISNHWQRMLVGLQDAGIRPNRDEQPEAFAKRVGIEGMSACATILERVRHGVRVDAEDLGAMSASASAVYRAARQRAGGAGRVLAWLRWPLA